MATLFLTCGLPCAGKTTLARRAEAKFNALRLTADDWLTTLFPEAKRAQMDASRMTVEKLQWAVAQRCLALGINVVLDHGVWGRDERAAYREVARAQGWSIVLCLSDPPLEELLRRVGERNQRLAPGEFFIDEGEIELWDTQFQRPDAEELALFDPEPD